MPVVKINEKQYRVSDGMDVLVPNFNIKEGENISAKDLLTGKEISLVVVGKKQNKMSVIKFRNKTRERKIGGQKIVYTRLRVANEVSVKEKKEPKKTVASKAKVKKVEKAK